MNDSVAPAVADVRVNGARRFLEDAIEGLTGSPKRMPCKYFYDHHGSRLFDEICRVPEYYLTRTEMAIMVEHAPAIAAAIGPCCQLIELGSGSSVKTRLLLERLERPAAYVPVDISKEHLLRSARALAERFPSVPVQPVHADFTGEFRVPEPPAPASRRVAYFPGSTIGNFEPRQALELLRRIRRIVDVSGERGGNGRSGGGGALLIGVDLKKSAAVLEAAYNDAAGVTRRFNLNLLTHMQRVLNARVDVDQFEHHAFYNDREGRVEMHLVSRARQAIHLDHTTVEFEPGETIHTENSYKYGLSEFENLAARAGFERIRAFTDARGLFSVQHFESRHGAAATADRPDS